MYCTWIFSGKKKKCMRDIRTTQTIVSTCSVLLWIILGQVTATPPTGGEAADGGGGMWRCAHGHTELFVSAPPASAALVKALCAPLIRSDVTAQRVELSLIRASCVEGQAEPNPAEPSESAQGKGRCVLQPNPGLFFSDMQVNKEMSWPDGRWRDGGLNPGRDGVMMRSGPFRWWRTWHLQRSNPGRQEGSREAFRQVTFPSTFYSLQAHVRTLSLWDTVKDCKQMASHPEYITIF